MHGCVGGCGREGVVWMLPITMLWEAGANSAEDTQSKSSQRKEEEEKQNARRREVFCVLLRPDLQLPLGRHWYGPWQ